VLGDPDQLQQVLLNLTVNAIQAVDGSGQVTLSTRFVPASTGQPERVEVGVTDTGPGITPEDESRIFDPFFTTKGAVGGTGLGLAISREIMLSHQGDLRVESVPGRGSCFIMALPPAGDDPGFDGQEKEHHATTDKQNPLADSRG
jgi:signal transduction histidine kinase